MRINTTFAQFKLCTQTLHKRFCRSSVDDFTRNVVNEVIINVCIHATNSCYFFFTVVVK